MTRIPLNGSLSLLPPGLLVTFTQFVLVAAIGFYDHFSIHYPPFYLKPNRVPLRRWMMYVLLFASVNILNNYALGFNISVPIHIILRSGGSVVTMAVGWLWGRRYTRLELFSVMLLTVGVIMAAMADADAKVIWSFYFRVPISPLLHRHILMSANYRNFVV